MVKVRGEEDVVSVIGEWDVMESGVKDTEPQLPST